MQQPQVNNQAITSDLVERNRFRNIHDFFGNEVTKELLIKTIIQNAHHNVNIFVGPPGTGKTSFAFVYAKSVNCENPLEPGVPCEECNSCLAASIKNGHPDIKEINAALDNGVDTSRFLSDFVKTKPVFKKKVVILDEWHRMSSNALDGLLTVFESASRSDASISSSDYMFIMPTTNVPKEHLALYSRAQRFFFNAMTRSELTIKLRDICNKSNILYEDSALELICSHCNNAARDSIRTLQSAAIFCEGNITKEKVQKLLSLEDSSLARDLLNALFQLNLTQLESSIKEYCQNRVITQHDFNTLSELIQQQSQNAAPCTHLFFTELLSLVIDGRTAFLSDCSNKPEDTLIVTCRKMYALLIEHLPVLIVDTIKAHDNYFGEVIASLNPACSVDSNLIAFLELNIPVSNPEYIISGLNSELMSQILSQFGVREYRFRNIAPDICNYVITQDRNFGEFLSKLNPEVLVENNSLVLALNAPPQEYSNYLQSGLNCNVMQDYFNSLNIRNCKFK